jgi:Cdc6-like AAA superfamily ATPase
VFHRQFLVGRDTEIESVQQKIVDFFVSPRPSSLLQPISLFQLNNISEQARQCFANGNKSSAPTVLTLIGKLIKKHELKDGSGIECSHINSNHSITYLCSPPESPKMSNLTTLFRRTSFAGRSPPPMMSKQRHNFSPCSVVFEGSPGSGKSLLVRTASESAVRLGIQVHNSDLFFIYINLLLNSCFIRSCRYPQTRMIV